MIKFEDLIIKWNNGTWRGAQTKFAQKIGVKPNTVSQWIKFSRPPDRDLRGIVSRKLGISEKELLDSFVEHAEKVAGRKQDIALVEAGIIVPNTTMGDTELEVSLPPAIFVQLRSYAEAGKRDINDQLIIILDDWFKRKANAFPPRRANRG